MVWLLPPLPPKWHAALRDVTASRVESRVAAAQRLARPAGAVEREQALDALGRLSRDADPRVRGAAVEGLAELADSRSLAALRERLEDPDPLVREIATLGLGDLPWTDAKPALLAALASPHPAVRFQAIAAVSRALEAGAIPHLATCFDDPDPHVRAAAVEALGVLEGATLEAERPRLLRLLRDDTWRVRVQAALVAARLPEPAATPVLRDALADRSTVLDALDAIPLLVSGSGRRGAEASELVERVAELAQRVLGSRLLAAAAGRALARVGDPRGEQVLRETLTSWRSHGRTLSVETIWELGLEGLLPELLALAARPRAVDPEVLAGALNRLAERAPAARAALEQLALRSDAFGAAARAVEAAIEGRGPAQGLPDVRPRSD